MKIDFADVAADDIERAIAQYIHSERDRRILRRKLLDGVCFERLAEEVNLSPRRVKTIVYKGAETVYKHI